ncbi:MAG: hypothetical protein LBF22_11490 [Deltaproteobacteria bacterium]|jgi:hypothetical protein|nr:hypothetical protein [Deltaproteobacteria bacterium]
MNPSPQPRLLAIVNFFIIKIYPSYPNYPKISEDMAKANGIQKTLKKRTLMGPKKSLRRC